jgi:outer membrane receptor protein involved in Fe transport
MDLFNDFTYYLINPIQGDQFEQQDRRIIAGVRGSYSWDTELLGRKSTFTVGVQTRNDDIRDGLYNTEDRTRLHAVSKDYVIETNVGFYAQNKTQWLDKFRTEGGVRIDYLNIHVDSNDAANSGVDNAVICSPSINLIFGPWDKTEFYLSGGEGYHSNDARGVTATQTPAYNTYTPGPPLAPVVHATPLVRGDGAEVGVRTGIIPGLQSTVSVWVLKLHSEQTFNGDTAESVPAGPTLRYGIELGNYFTPSPYLTIDADYSLSRAKYTDNEPAGNDVPESIQNVAEAGITFHDLPQFPKLFGSFRVRYFGPRPLVQDDSVQSQSSTICDAELGYRLDSTWTLKVDAINLFDTKTDDIEYYYTYRLPGQPAAGVSGKVIHPAEPLEIRASIEARF